MGWHFAAMASTAVAAAVWTDLRHIMLSSAVVVCWNWVKKTKNFFLEHKIAEKDENIIFIITIMKRTF